MENLGSLKTDLDPQVRALLIRMVNLELVVLPALKGELEKEVREVIWAAYDVLVSHRTAGEVRRAS